MDDKKLGASASAGLGEADVTVGSDSPEGAARVSPRYQNFILVSVIILLVGVASVIVQMKVTTIMTDVVARFSMDSGQISLFMSMFTFVGLILALPVGFLAKRFGAKQMLLAGVAVVILGSLVGAFAGGSTMLVVSRAVEGIAYIIIVTCGPIAIERYVAPERLGTAMGIWAMYGCGGTVIAGLVTPSLYAAIGYVGLWLTYAAFALLAGLLLLFIVRNPGNVLSAKQATSPKPADEKAEKPNYKAFFTGNMILFFLPYVAYNILVSSTLSYAPTFMQSHGMSQALSGVIITVPMAIAVASSLVFGMLVDRFGRCKPLYIVALLMMGPATFLFFSTTGAGMWAAAVMLGLLGMGVTAVCPTAFVRILNCPALVGVGMGLLKLMQCLGQTIGNYGVPVLLGPDFSNWPLAATVALCVGLAGTVSIAICKFK